MLRPAILSDAPRTRAFRIALLKEALPTIFSGHPPSLAEQETWHRKFAEDENALLLLYLDGERVIGLLGFEPFSAPPECRHAGTFGVSVLAPHRGQGIGRQLLTALIEWAAAHRTVRRLELEVLSNNPRAEALYTRFGFSVEGRRQRAVATPGGGYLDAIMMAKWVPPRD